MNKYREMKLGQILATVNSKLAPNGATVNVVTDDGVVVMTGTIEEIRERVAFNCHFHDDPIHSGRAKLSLLKNGGGKTSLAQEKIVQQKNGVTAMGPRDKVHTEDRARSNGTAGDEGRDKRGGPAGARTVRANRNVPGHEKLPDNRVGALQEMYHADGTIPRYEFKDTGDTPVLPGEYHHCSVRVGHLLCWGKGLTKKAAKQDAAGVMLLDIMRGRDPFKVDKRGGKNRGVSKVVPDERIAKWEDLYLQKFDRYPRQDVLGKPKRIRPTLKDNMMPPRSN